MGVAKKWVFPIIRLVLLAVLVVALVKLAFFADSAEAQDPTFPTGEITQPQVQVTVGTIVNSVKVTGQVVADAAVPVRATGAGTVDEVFITEGKPVKKGDKIFDIRVETMPGSVASASVPRNISGGSDGTGGHGETGGSAVNGGSGGTVVTPPPPPVYVEPQPIVTFAKVYAPADGILSSLTVIHGQMLAVGDVAGQVAPPTFSVTGSMTPEQLFGLVDEPDQAEITIAHGPAPFTCTGLEITTPLAGAPTGESTAESGTVVRCAVPADIRVFAGLSAEITIPGGTAEGVLTVPTTAVKGSSQSGIAWLILPDGTTQETEVSLGLNDGFTVEIAGGLAEGDTVLEFVPGAVPVDPWAGWEPGMPEPMPNQFGGEDCFQEQDGSTTCVSVEG
ncbi:efflux RND transporter periplasmic adaptor subunit [Homoserinimonas sp. OAct 916]|uniref:efflux RND transporter periplasmic adaptor subunit n=1 Tax=Homoserinimonas sp. OAct 916 TaxID=2211450 RepID=UPI000DBE653A|nr:efflux RND transporter periplasmic adaptor subunit [Homoserinimonas sp. OAct 916]